MLSESIVSVARFHFSVATRIEERFHLNRSCLGDRVGEAL